jgi:hypothetical protein
MDASDEEDTGDVAMLFSKDFVSLMSTNKKIKKIIIDKRLQKMNP